MIQKQVVLYLNTIKQKYNCRANKGRIEIIITRSNNDKIINFLYSGRIEEIRERTTNFQLCIFSPSGGKR